MNGQWLAIPMYSALTSSTPSNGWTKLYINLLKKLGLKPYKSISWDFWVSSFTIEQMNFHDNLNSFLGATKPLPFSCNKTLKLWIGEHG